MAILVLLFRFYLDDARYWCDFGMKRWSSALNYLMDKSTDRFHMIGPADCIGRILLFLHDLGNYYTYVITSNWLNIRYQIYPLCTCKTCGLVYHTTLHKVLLDSADDLHASHFVPAISSPPETDLCTRLNRPVHPDRNTC